MPEIIHGEQGTTEWSNARCASIGGTAINDIAPGGKGYKKLLYEFAGEMITGIKASSFKFQHADRGLENENETWNLYSFLTGNPVEHVSMVKSDQPHKHYSADALIGGSGIGEGKTRIPSIFVQATIDGYFPIATRRQCQWGLSICEREWVDYCQFCPEIHNAGFNGLLIHRVTRDEKMIKELHEVADKFIEEMLGIVDTIKGGL